MYQALNKVLYIQQKVKTKEEMNHQLYDIYTNSCLGTQKDRRREKQIVSTYVCYCCSYSCIDGACDLIIIMFTSVYVCVSLLL